MASRQAKLRFDVGSRVACNMGSEWAHGKVVALNYREDHWPPGRVAPYQVQLEGKYGGNLIFAPADIPRVIRAVEDAPPVTESFPANGDAAVAQRALQDEIAAVRGLPFVEAVEEPRLMGIAESAGDLKQCTSSSGPWVVPVLLRGPAGAAYDSVFRINIKVNAAWPNTPPEIRFCSIIHHPLVDDDGEVSLDILADAMATCRETSRSKDGQASSGTYSLRIALNAMNLLLAHPERVLSSTPHVKQAQTMNSKRLHVISAYVAGRKHPRLFDSKAGWDPEWFDPAFLEAASAGTDEAWRSIVKEEAWEVYSFPLFTPEFCDMYVEEIYSFYASGLPARRPNSMNNYGVVVNEIGMEPMLDVLQQEYLQPIGRLFFPGVGSHFDHHHSFIVRYKIDEDLGLDVHCDDSDVTFNVCMGRDFKGAGLQFCGNQGSAKHRKSSLVYQHVKGRCVVHTGYRRHGADDLTEGERLNLIVWNKNSEYRKSQAYKRHTMQSRGTGYEKEEGPPDPVCLSFTHDRDYGVFKEYEAKNKDHEGRGWCPPRHAEYDSFRPEDGDADDMED